MWQRGLGQVIKELKRYPALEPSCPIPAVGSPRAAGEDKAEISPLFPASPDWWDRGTCQVQGVQWLWGGPGPRPARHARPPCVLAHHFISERSLNLAFPGKGYGFEKRPWSGSDKLLR